MWSTLKCFYLLIPAYNSLAFFAYSCLFAISTGIIHSWLIFLFIYAIISFFPDPAFMNIIIVWEKSKILSSPALGFGTERVQAIRDATAQKILLEPVALEWNRLGGCRKVADEEWNQCSGVQGAKNTECKQILWAVMVEASN